MNTPTTPSLSITWEQPAFIISLYCLCPLLAASNSLATAVALSLVMTWLTVGSALLIALARIAVPKSSVIIANVCLCSMWIAITEMSLHAWNYESYRKFGMFLPLSIIACLLICRDEMAKISHRELMSRVVKFNGGFAFAAIVLGSGREIVGHGTLFNDVGQFFGSHLNWATVTFFPADMGFVMGVLAPGAFIGFGIGVALYNWLWLQKPSKK